MPTSRTRHMITESDQLSDCLTAAATIWPEIADERTALLRKVIEEGIKVVQVKSEENRKAKKKIITDLAKTLKGTWPEDWLEQRKLEWPE